MDHNEGILGGAEAEAEEPAATEDGAVASATEGANAEETPAEGAAAAVHSSAGGADPAPAPAAEGSAPDTEEVPTKDDADISALADKARPCNLAKSSVTCDLSLHMAMQSRPGACMPA